jgi:hypothetical protein
MSDTRSTKARLELLLQPTGKGRRMRAVRPDGSIVATGRNFGDLRERLSRTVSELYGPSVQVALMVGKPPVKAQQTALTSWSSARTVPRA